MKTFFKSVFFISVTSIFAPSLQGQNFNINAGQIHGNMQIDAQYFVTDTLIGSTQPPEEFLMNAFTNLIYTNGNFSAGIRYEAYLPAIQGYPTGYDGMGIPYRFAEFTSDELTVTAGNFYEQFGSGMILRAYTEPLLGVDNSIDGMRVKYNPAKGIYLKGLVGKQRLYFSKGPGLVRGFDGEININEMMDSAWANKKTKVILGGSFVSKYQDPTSLTYILPANVGSWATRMNIIRGPVNFYAEYVYKINDPSGDNRYIYKPGEGLLTQLNFNKKGLGLSLAAKYIDNMSFRSDRDAKLNDLMINFNPALTKPHTYNLAATLYPYATQPTGEWAFQGEISYKFKAKTALGGKYGTSFSVNYAMATGLDTTKLYDDNTSRLGYSSNFGLPGDNRYFEDFNVEIRKKLSDKFKFVLMYIYMVYDYEIIRGEPEHDQVTAHIGVFDLNYKINKKHNIRMEVQHLYTEQDLGSWATALVEYTVSPHWFAAVLDQYNYGNEEEIKRLHYPYFTFGYVKNTNRITLGYGKQRAGLFCVGGVCRPVPASSGLTLSITSSF